MTSTLTYEKAQQEGEVFFLTQQKKFIVYRSFLFGSEQITALAYYKNLHLLAQSFKQLDT